jgi:hypothetical protein
MNAKELAELFGAAAEEIEAILPWNPPKDYKGTWTSRAFQRSDYAQQEAMAAAFRGIAKMYAKIAETAAGSTRGEPG